MGKKGRINKMNRPRLVIRDVKKWDAASIKKYLILFLIDIWGGNTGLPKFMVVECSKDFIVMTKAQGLYGSLGKEYSISKEEMGDYPGRLVKRLAERMVCDWKRWIAEKIGIFKSTEIMESIAEVKEIIYNKKRKRGR